MMVVTLSICACSSNGDIKASRPLIPSIAKEAQRLDPTPPALPPEITQSLLPPLRFTSPTTRHTDTPERFDLNADGADVRQLLSDMARGTPYSISAQPDVQGTVSVHLKNVTLLDALDSLRDLYGFEYQREGNRILVFGNTIATRMFPVNYLNFSRKGKSDLTVNASGISKASTSSSGGASSNSGSVGVDVSTESEANFWKDLTTALTALIGDADGRKVVANPQSGVVVVRATPKELRMVSEFLGLTHATLNRQVVLEAKILEVELSDQFQSGINWSGVMTVGSSTVRNSQVSGGSLPELNGVGPGSGNSADLSSTTPSASTTSAFGGIFSMAIRGTDFNAFVELLRTQGNVQVLSSPRVSTVNNQKAVIKVGGDEYFVTGVTNSSSTSGSTTTQTPTVELQPFFSGIALDVTPQIDERDNINLHIHPAVSEVSQKSKSFVIGSQSFNIPLAYSTVQESDNVVRARTGQVIVIGGLMKESLADEQSSVPWLSEIPWLGELFKRKSITRIKKELVILLKPTVVDVDGSQWPQQWEASRQRLRTINGMASQ